MSSLVSIIIPVHNSAAFLSQLVMNLSLISFRNWECIFINNNSTDNSLALLTQLAAGDLRLKVHDWNETGVSAARNYGLSVATGKYIQFLDADDLLSPRKLEFHSSYLDENPQTGLVFSDARYFKDGNPEELILPPWNSRSIAALQGEGEYLLLELLKGNRLVVSAPLFRRELLRLTGYFNCEMAFNEDWDFWIRMARTGAKFHFIEREDCFSLIRLHSTSGSNNLTGMYSSELSIYRREYLNLQNSAVVRKLAKRYFYKTWLEIFLRRIKGDSIAITQLPRWIQ